MTRKWHVMSVADIEKEFNTSAVSGLSKKQRHHYGSEKNSLFPHIRRSLLLCLLESFRDPLCILLPLLAILAAFFNRTALGITVLALTVVGYGTIGFAYYRTQRIGERMRSYSNPLVRVIRNGKLITVDTRVICPGDVILFSRGDIIPCDARLIASQRLKVTEYVKTDGKVLSHLSDKNYSAEYTEQSRVNPPDCLNMVYGGSAVISGSGRAICVAVGDETYLGALTGGIAPSRDKEENTGLKSLRSYYRAFNIITAGLMIPFSVIGIVFLSDIEAIDIFLTALAIVCTSSGSCISIFGRIISSAEASKMAGDADKGNVVLMNSPVHDKLCSADTLLLLGTAGISDGKYHIRNGEDISASLAGYAYMFDITKRSIPSTYSDDDLYLRRYSDCIKDFVLSNGIDAEEYRIKIKSASYISCPPQTTEGAEIKFADGTEFLIFMSTDGDLITACDYERIDGKVLPIDSARRAELNAFFNNSVENGYSVLSYSTASDGAGIFEGMILLKETADPSVAYNADDLAAIGTDVRIFLYGKTAENAALLHDAGIYDIIISDGRHTLFEVFGTHRAFIGFSREEISKQIEILHKENHVIASAGAAFDDYSLMNTCDAVISFDKTNIGKPIYENSFDGYDSSERCSQITRVASDVLVNRTPGKGKGIDSIKRSFIAVRRVYRKLSDMINVLIVSQFTRLFLTVFPLILGKSYLLTAPELLFSGFAVDFISVLIFAFSNPSAEKLMPERNIPDGIIHPISNAKFGLISSAVSSCAAIFIAETVNRFNGLGVSDGRNTFLFVSLLLIQFIYIYAVLLGQKEKKERHLIKSPGFLYWISLGAVLIITAVLIIIPTSPDVGFCGFSWVYFAFAFIPPVLFISLSFIVRKIAARGK